MGAPAVAAAIKAAGGEPLTPQLGVPGATLVSNTV